MADEVVVTPDAPVTPAPVVDAAVAAPVAPTPTPGKDAPVDAAVSGEKPADKIAEFVKKGTLLGEKAGEEKVEGKKEGDEAVVKVDGAVPEKYEFKVPDGMAVDTEMAEAVTPVFKDLKLSQEAVDKLTAAYAPIVAKQAEAAKTAALKAFDEQIEGWGKETKAMLGADPLKAMAPAAKLIDTFAGKDATAFRTLLNDTGLGNHPLMVKFLIAAGKAIGQDSFVDGGNSAGADSEDAFMARNYPTMVKK